MKTWTFITNHCQTNLLREISHNQHVIHSVQVFNSSSKLIKHNQNASTEKIKMKQSILQPVITIHRLIAQVLARYQFNQTCKRQYYTRSASCNPVQSRDRDMTRFLTVFTTMFPTRTETRRCGGLLRRRRTWAKWVPFPAGWMATPSCVWKKSRR